MSGDRNKSRPTRRNTPNARSHDQRRLQLQPVRGRYPVLPPVGQSWPVYPVLGGQNFIIPTPTYPMPQMMPAYNCTTQTAIPFNVFQAQQQPYVAIPTSMVCYYAPMSAYEWTSNQAITEVLPEQASGGNIEQSMEDLLPHIQRTILYYDPMLLLKICEEISFEIVEAIIGEMTQEVVTTCINEIVKSYLGRAHLLSASSLKRPRPKLAKEEVRPSTNPVVASQGGRQSSLLSRYGPKQKKELLQPLTPQSQRRRGAGLSSVEKLPVSEHKLKRSTREIAEHSCLIILDELLFQQFLEIAIVGGVHRTAEALADNILNKLLFEGFLKQIFEKQVSSRRPLPSTPVL